MGNRVTIYKKMEVQPGVIRKIPLRNIVVHDSFVGIGRKGVHIRAEFQRLVDDLEPAQLGLGFDIIEV